MIRSQALLFVWQAPPYLNHLRSPCCTVSVKKLRVRRLVYLYRSAQLAGVPFKNLRVAMKLRPLPRLNVQSLLEIIFVWLKAKKVNVLFTFKLSFLQKKIIKSILKLIIGTKKITHPVKSSASRSPYGCLQQLVAPVSGDLAPTFGFTQYTYIYPGETLIHIKVYNLLKNYDTGQLVQCFSSCRSWLFWGHVSRISDIYITVYNSCKVTVIK